VATEPFEHAQNEANGITVHTVSTGIGPLVVFCHAVRSHSANDALGQHVRPDDRPAVLQRDA
jgi:hypothetical protein